MATAAPPTAPITINDPPGIPDAPAAAPGGPTAGGNGKGGGKATAAPAKAPAEAPGTGVLCPPGCSVLVNKSEALASFELMDGTNRPVLYEAEPGGVVVIPTCYESTAMARAPQFKAALRGPPIPRR